MNRRELVRLFCVTVALPLLVRRSVAQPVGKVWRISYLSTRPGPNELSDSLLQGLRELGYIDSKNLHVEFQSAAGKNDRLLALALEAVDAKVDLIVTEGTPATEAAIHATRSIPIVFASAQDPVEKGIVDSLAQPGGNATGMALIADQSKPLELLKEAVPAISQVAFLFDPATRPGPYGETSLTLLQQNATKLGVMMQPVILRDPDEVDAAFATFAAGTNGVLVENSLINSLAQQRICQLATEQRLPTVGSFGAFTSAGCLMSYGENLPAVYRRAAGYVDRIFKGAKPSDLPVTQATVFDLKVNLKAAKALGLEIPTILLARADEVIE
jgi:putative ABC transport system substrate-binding protein